MRKICKPKVQRLERIRLPPERAEFEIHFPSIPHMETKNGIVNERNNRLAATNPVDTVRLSSSCHTDGEPNRITAKVAKASIVVPWSNNNRISGNRSIDWKVAMTSLFVIAIAEFRGWLF